MTKKIIDTSDFYLQSSDVVQDYYDLAEDIFVQVDSKMFIIDCNLKFCALQNKTRQELIGKRFLTFIHEKSLEVFKTIAVQTIEKRINKKKYNLTLYIRKLKKLKVELHFYPINSSTGVLSGWFFKFTPAELKDESIEEYKSTVLTMYQSLSNVYTIINSSTNGLINHVNSNLCSILGYKDRELIGTNIKKLYDVESEEGKINFKNMQRQLVKKNSFVGEITLVAKDGTSVPFFLTVSSLMHKNSVVGRLGVGRDLTVTKQLEDDNKTIRTQLENQSKLAEFGSMLQGVAHNLNTPLTGIKSSAQLQKAKLKKFYKLLKDIMGEIDPKVDKLFSSIVKSSELVDSSSEKLSKIISNMMAKARQQQSTIKEDINLAEIMNQELEFLMTNMFFKHKVEKIFDIQKELPIIQGLYADFSQTFVNLIKNGLDAMYKRDDKILEIKIYEEGENIIVKIKDTGKGIPPDVRAKIFNPFFTTKPKLSDSKDGEPAGTGIGLDNVKTLMKPYKTKIKVASEVGVGTEFILSIPVKENQREELRNIDTKKLASILKST